MGDSLPTLKMTGCNEEHNMRLFRVEHRDTHKGPFCGTDYRNTWGWQRYRRDDYSNPPGCETPYYHDDDSDAMVAALREWGQPRHIVYGCATFEGLRIWFTSAEWSNLVELGYHVVSYEVQVKVAVLRTQCVWPYRPGRKRRMVDRDLYEDC